MKILVTMKSNDFESNFSFDDQMQIEQTLKIISDSLNVKLTTEVNYIWSKRQKKNISIYFTFKQANIVSGDVLIIGDIKDGKN